MNLIAIGDNVVDIYQDRNEMFPGGNALNVAVLSKQYGAKKTAFIGIIGNDVEGEHILRSLKQNQVDTSLIRIAEGESGKAYVDLNEEGDRIFIKSNKGGIQSKLKLRLTEEEYGYIKNYDVLHTSIYSHLDEELQQLKSILPISYDFSNHFTEELLEKVCPHITFAFCSGSHLSDHEIEELLMIIHRLGTPNVIITRGSLGVVMSSKNKRYSQGIIKANVVDTLGAGDSFIASYLTTHFNGLSIELSLEIAAKNAAKTCEVNGAFGCGKQLIG
ncbi:fructoselysine 6-kinase [Bacillus pakistanensis]|uniref:Fructoselysine 6-kinase n=1 Tax=Rossellomorea pakistanensis TaxID=992288 RepID=A0ABS2NJW6_9BACI|nr:PfkB family carbohydrate kinase [Bacillus pakistanensis]MBM7588098.1 fructoselysine 6-kinase [Bacillus pakistanensis]